MPGLDARVPGARPDRGLARLAEESGFDGLLLADSQNLVGDPFVELGVAAGVTHRIGLGTGIVNLVTRHPAVVAAAIASVQVESGGGRCWGSAGAIPPWPRSGSLLPRRPGCGTS